MLSRRGNYMEILKDRYTITELSKRLGVTDHTLRYYEREFNLQIPKDSRGRRYYTPETANLMFQIKSMRNDGLEIKAIRKILQSENRLADPPPVIVEDKDTMSVTTARSSANPAEIEQFFNNFKDQLIVSVSNEVSTTREYLLKEINKSKLEIGACVENSVRKLESKMDKHFENVDLAIENWRKKNNKGFFERIKQRVFK
jgi:DNA-binding transcriptional MerR regulator